MGVELARKYSTRGIHGLRQVEDSEAHEQLSKFFDSTNAQKTVNGGSTSVILKREEISLIVQPTAPHVIGYEYPDPYIGGTAQNVPRRTEFSDEEIDGIIHRALNLTEKSAA